ncbi:MAG TPA: hypothetical protein VGM07_06235 [Stellaceae bacterium]|jgi:hypothetical protein
MNETITKGEFAQRAGRSPSAVSKWIAFGKIWGPAMTPDGRIVVEEAERQLAQSLAPCGRPPGLTLSDAQRGRDAPEGARRLLREIADVRLQREKLALIEAERAAAAARAELVRAAESWRAWRAEMDALEVAIGEFVVELPAKLGLGSAAAELARREWHVFQRRRAEQA